MALLTKKLDEFGFAHLAEDHGHSIDLHIVGLAAGVTVAMELIAAILLSSCIVWRMGTQQLANRLRFLHRLISRERA